MYYLYLCLLLHVWKLFHYFTCSPHMKFVRQACTMELGQTLKTRLQCFLLQIVLVLVGLEPRRQEVLEDEDVGGGVVGVLAVDDLWYGQP